MSSTIGSPLGRALVWFDVQMQPFFLYLVTPPLVGTELTPSQQWFMTGCLGHITSSRFFNQTHTCQLPIARALVGDQQRQSHWFFFLIQTSTMAGTTVCCPHMVSSWHFPKCHVQAKVVKSWCAFSIPFHAAMCLEDPVLHGPATTRKGAPGCLRLNKGMVSGFSCCSM